MRRIVPLFLFLALASTVSSDPAADRQAFKNRILSLHEAAYHGDRQAKKEIKRLKATGEGQDGDFINVFELIDKAEKAKKPDEFTLLAIGHAYYYGRGGLEIDKKKGVYWYARAARAGSKVGIYNLGIGYFRGNEAQAKDWTLAQGLLQAANALTPDGDKNSIWTLAAMAKDEGDYNRAFLLFSQLGPKEPYGYWEAAQLAESGKASDVAEPQSVALELYNKAGSAGWRRGNAEAGRLYLLSPDPALRDPVKALRSFLAALADEPLDGPARQVIEETFLGKPASDPRPSHSDLSASAIYTLLESAATTPDLADDWDRFNRLLKRYWPSDSTL